MNNPRMRNNSWEYIEEHIDEIHKLLPDKNPSVIERFLLHFSLILDHGKVVNDSGGQQINQPNSISRYSSDDVRKKLTKAKKVLDTLSPADKNNIDLLLITEQHLHKNEASKNSINIDPKSPDFSFPDRLPVDQTRKHIDLIIYSLDTLSTPLPTRTPDVQFYNEVELGKAYLNAGGKIVAKETSYFAELIAIFRNYAEPDKEVRSVTQQIARIKDHLKTKK